MVLAARYPEGLSRRGWGVVLAGLAIGVFGVAVLVWPGLTGRVLVALVGLVLFALGLVLAYGALQLREAVPLVWLAALLPAIALTVFGAIVLLFPDQVTQVLLVVVAVLAAITGVWDVVSSFAMAKVVPWWWLRALRGVLLVALAVWVLVTPVSGLVALGSLVGLAALALAAVTIAMGVLALRLT